MAARLLTTLSTHGGVGKELKLSVCQGMLPHEVTVLL